MVFGFAGIAKEL